MGGRKGTRSRDDGDSDFLQEDAEGTEGLLRWAFASMFCCFLAFQIFSVYLESPQFYPFAPVRFLDSDFSTGGGPRRDK